MIDFNAMLLPKNSWKQDKKAKRTVKQKKKRSKPKHKKVKSIMQPKEDRRCYLCMLLNDDFSYKVNLEEHHVIFGSGRREISNKYGLLVNLCREHHRTSEAAVHNNKENSDLLKRKAQERFMEEYPDLDWMEIVGKNYL